MRITIIGFWKLLPKVINLLIGTLLLYGFFAILLVKIYKNDFYYCDGHSKTDGYVDTVAQCLQWGGNWVQRKLNVSNFIQSLVYLFLQATTQGWSTQVIQAASLRGQGESPIVNSNQIMYFFFSIFFFFGNLIMLNAFLGLSINNFKKIKQQMTGFNKLKQLDKTWFSIKNNIYRMIPLVKQKIPQNMIGQFVYNFMQSRYIKILQLIFFVLFMLNMSFYETNMSEQKQKTVQMILNISIGVLILQYFLILIAYGIHSRNIKTLLMQTIAILYIIISLTLTNVLSLQPRTSRILQAVNVCLICIRYFALLTQIQFIKK